MSSTDTATVPTGTDQLATDRWAGTPLATEHWLESRSGFPAGSAGEDGPGADTTVATARGIGLTRRQLDEVVAFTEFLAGSALSGPHRAELEDDIVDAFEDSPKQATRFLDTLSGGVRRVGSMEPLERCQRRLQALTTTYVAEQRRLADGAEPSPVMAVVARHNPLVRYWASTGVVLVADAVTARIEQHRLVLSLVGREPEDPPGLRTRLLEGTGRAGRLENAELAASELRLLGTRAWLRDLGGTALDRLREELERAVASALDVDIVVQQVAYRAALSLAG